MKVSDSRHPIDYATAAPFAIGFFDPQLLGLQKTYARDLLTHVNSFTGNAYANEPALAFIEINNENGLIQALLSSQLDNLPGYYTNELQKQWNTWLYNRYATQAQLLQNWHLFTTPQVPSNSACTSSMS